MNKSYTCIEFDSLNLDGIQKKAYLELFDLALTEEGRSVLKAYPGYLKMQNHVGIIQTRSGFVLEILPKVHTKQNDAQESRKTYLRMLRTIRCLPCYKNLDTAHLSIRTMPLFEVFISMFINEVYSIVQKGIKSDYIAMEENCSFMRGRLVIGEHIKQNAVHRERFYVNYDSYLPDIPHKRLLKGRHLSFASSQSIV